MKIDDRVIVITGTRKGIGRFLAEYYLAQNMIVCGCSRSACDLDNSKYIHYELDVADEKAVEKMVNDIYKRFRKIDYLVNNAGILDHGTAAIDSVKDEDINAVIDINAKGTIYFTREVAKVMAEQKSGAIVNTASVAGVVGNGGAAYVASKGAVIALTKNVALRMASIGVRCNAVCPGTVNTPMTSSDNLKNLDMNMLGAIMAHMDKNVPICQPEDVANTILFLASDEAKAITGQIIVTDFGATL